MAGNKKRARLRTGGVLAALGLLFATSVALRIADLDLNVVPAAVASDPDIGAVDIGPTSPLRAALDEVEALRARLEGREAELDDRERAIEAAQMLVEARLAELEAAEMRLADLIQISDAAAENDLSQLTEVYQTMPPDEAAALFEQMDPSFAAGFLSRMSAESSAAIMSELNPRVAYAVSVVIATRNAGAPTLSEEEAAEDPDTES